MQLLFPVVFLLISLTLLVKGADWFVAGAKKVGLALGMSSFIVGVLIVGIGTSLPELASSIAGVLSGAPTIVIANALGSNITNILLIVGFMAAVSGPIFIKQDLIKSELPIFLIATVHFVVAVYDGVIDQLEGGLLVGTFIAYLWYLHSQAKEDRKTAQKPTGDSEFAKAFFLLFIGIAAVLVGAHFTVQNAIMIATSLSVPIGLVSIAAIAIGTSLPELFVSVQAIRSGEADLAVGNIFGSNAFNILMVVGLPALWVPLPADSVVMDVGLAIFVAASVIFFVNGLSRQLMRWEGVMMLLFFGYFLAKLATLV